MVKKEPESERRERMAFCCRGSGLCKDLEGHAVGCFPVAGAEERACRGRGVRASWGDGQRPARRPLVTLLRSTDVVQNPGRF